MRMRRTGYPLTRERFFSIHLQLYVTACRQFQRTSLLSRHDAACDRARLVSRQFGSIFSTRGVARRRCRSCSWIVLAAFARSVVSFPSHTCHTQKFAPHIHTSYMSVVTYFALGQCYPPYATKPTILSNVLLYVPVRKFVPEL